MRTSFFTLLSLGLSAGLNRAAALPVVEERSAGTLTSTQVASYKPYTWYASTAYCTPATILSWTCGTNCASNPTFTPVASGGDGALVQHWYVGYDSALSSIIVAFQGTDATKILPLITDISMFQRNLDSTLFPGVSNLVKVHDGFVAAHERSATPVLAAVQSALASYATTNVTIVGHSLGGAIAAISTLHLSIHLPSTTTLKTVSYGAPRVGNSDFATLVNTKSEMTRIVNQDDIVPIVPGQFLGYVHTEGEVHILDSHAWVDCPGVENSDFDCTIGYVPNLWSGDINDHMGPFDGVTLGC